MPSGQLGCAASTEYDSLRSAEDDMAGMGMDDPLLAILRYAPIVFVIAGVGFVVWLARQRLPFELQPDILAALSDTEALPTSAIRQRPPLAYQNVDTKTLAQVLERLCNDGLVVRWYEVADEAGRERQAVYRRVTADMA
jgi:hypothetical protein